VSSPEFDQLVAQFEDFQSRLKHVEEPLADVAAMQSELEALQVTVSSPDHAVTVVAGVGGSVQDIRFTESAMQLGSQRLSAVVMTTLRDAVAEAARRQASIVQEHVGGDAPVLDQVLETQAEVTGVPVEELRAKVEGETPQRRHTPVGEEEQSIVFRDNPAPATPPATGDAADSFLKSVWDEEER
jgi:DNA-binding protein YbaB